MDEKKIRTMDKILVFLAAFLILFVAVMIWLYLKTGGIPDTLVGCVFAVCGTECGAMAWIKNVKERYRERKFELEDRDHEEQKEEKP